MKTTQETVFENNLKDTLHPCLQGKVIASLPEIRTYMTEFRQLISVPNDIYEELYIPTFHHFMMLCQNMPEDMQNPVPYSLLKRRFEFAIAVLKLRRGYMLPTHSNSETIVEQEPLWTYALLTASLLINIHYIQADRYVELYKTQNKKLSMWHLAIGRLYERGTYYKITRQTPRLLFEIQPLQIHLIGRIIPELGLRWLYDHPTLASLWLQTVTIEQPAENTLTQLLQQAAQAVDFSLEKSSRAAIDASVQSTLSQEELENIAQPFLDWLMSELKKNEHKSKLPTFLRVPEGLFITEELLEKFILQNPEIHSTIALANKFRPIFLEKGGLLFFRYCSVHFENRQILTGTILREECLDESFKVYTIRTDFIPDISL